MTNSPYLDLNSLQASDSGSIPIATIRVEGRVLHRTRLTTSMSVARYLDVAIKPSDWLDPEKAAPSDRRFIAEHLDTHSKTQRKFSGAKAKNVESLIEYVIEDILIEERGMLPQFILWTDGQCSVADSVTREGFAPIAILNVPQRLMVLDGETRTEALFKLVYGPTRERLTDDQLSRLLGMNLDVCLLHGITDEQAAKVFVDINHRGVRVNAALAMTMDTRDPLSRVAKKVAERLDLRLSSGRQAGETSESDITMLRLRQMAMAFIMGTNKAVQIGTKVLAARDIAYEGAEGLIVAPLVKAEDEQKTVDAFAGWLSDLFGVRGSSRGIIGTWSDTNDSTKAAGSGPVIIALAGLGHCRLIGDIRSEHEIKRMLAEDIAWTVNPRWDGLAGDVKPDGHGSWKVASASPKQTGTMVSAALSDETSIYWSKLRRPLTDADLEAARQGQLDRLRTDISGLERQKEAAEQKLSALANAGKTATAAQRRKPTELASRIFDLRAELDALTA